RRNQIRFEPAIAGRTTTREKADAVSVWFEPVRGADSDHAVSIARISDTESRIAFVRTILGIESLVTEITRGGDDDHAAFYQSFAFSANRRAPARKIAHVVRNRETQIRAVNAEIRVSLI